MKKEVILVPKDKCPLDVLSEMGERIRNSWIFLHANAYEHLLKSEGASYSMQRHLNANQVAMIEWEDTLKYPKTFLGVELPEPKGWGKITYIDVEDTYFVSTPSDPEDIYFLKMDE